MKNALIAACLSIAFFAPSAVGALTYSQSFGLDPSDTFGANPYSVTNAFIRHETFAPQIQYWQPAAPNVWSEVVYRFDLPFAIDTASTYMSIGAYTVGHPDANFDNNAQSYLDVSPDGTNYTNVLGAYPGHATGYDTFTNFPNGDGDISSIVQGSNTVYIRARQFMTANYAGFNASQFLRHAAGETPFNLTATGVPEPSSLAVWAIALLSGVALRLLGKRKRGRVASFNGARGGHD